MKEFIYDDNLNLKTELVYGRTLASFCSRSVSEDYEKMVYNYKDNRVDQVVVYDTNNAVTRKEYYYYTNDTLSKIKFAVYVDRWSINFDYGSDVLKWPGYERDTITFFYEVQEFGSHLWHDPGSSYYSYTLDANGNIENFRYRDTHLILSYDGHENPFFKFKNSRPLPIRMSPNNVVRIESRFVGPGYGGGVVLKYIANISYQYDGENRPTLGVYKYDCGTPDTVKYIYDKIRH